MSYVTWIADSRDEEECQVCCCFCCKIGSKKSKTLCSRSYFKKVFCNNWKKKL